AAFRSLKLEECNIGLAGGVVRWVNPSPPYDEHRLLVKLDPERRAERFVPTKFQRFQQQWPCADCGPTEEVTVSIPLAETCLRRGVAGTPSVQLHDFVLEPIGRANCPAGLGRYGPEGWCESDLASGTERYRVRAWWVATPVTEGDIVVRTKSVWWRGRLSPRAPWHEGRIDDEGQLIALRER